jgi:hypothetical protein
VTAPRPRRHVRPRHHRVTRGVLILLTSFLNLLGAFAVLASLGGLAQWSAWQIVGMFGLIEAATGLAFLLAPNIWRLPIAEVRTGGATSVRLAPELLLVPQPAALPKAFAGALLIAGAAWTEGVGWRTLGVIPALSLVIARLGVARPDVDVVSLIVRRIAHADREIGPFTLSGVAVQLGTQVGVIPIVKLASPSILFRPELVPSLPLVVALMAVTCVLGLCAYAAWHDRIDLHAPAEQRLEAERDLSG